jgi:ParE toxin of type II toxin-antitoxin system, parDE
MKVEFHPKAEKEFVEAVTFYETCKNGLGESFAFEVYSTIKNIQSYPYAWPILEKDIRRCLVNRFPFGVIYSIETDRIYILAVMHLHRYPKYWKTRK